MSKLFKTAMLLFTAILWVATANAAEFFVDPDLGDDTFDGSSPKPEGGGSKTGPRKTLVGVMELVTANNGDVVYAAPGRYSSLKTTGNYRVSIPAGTSLIASGKAEETFIIGENAPGVAVDASPSLSARNRPRAEIPVRMRSDAYILTQGHGFTGLP